MMFYVLMKQAVFNTFATIKLPLDMWSKIDIFCAVSNISCFMAMTTIDEKAVTGGPAKIYYNFLMIFVITATWLRIVGLFYVVPGLSELVLTLEKMLGSATTFICIICCYLLVVATISKTLF